MGGNQEFTLSGKPPNKAITADGTKNPRLNHLEETKIGSSNGDVNSLKSNEMWTDLYQPKRKEDLVGNEGLVAQIEDWLKDWDDLHIRGNKKTLNYGGGGGFRRGGGQP
jgi:hypothetical protein